MLGKRAAAGTKGWKPNLSDLSFMQKQFNTHPRAAAPRDTEVKLGHFPRSAQPELLPIWQHLQKHRNQTDCSLCQADFHLCVQNTVWSPDPWIVHIRNETWSKRELPIPCFQPSHLQNMGWSGQSPPFGLQLRSSTALLLMRTIAQGILASSFLAMISIKMDHIWWNMKTVLVSKNPLNYNKLGAKSKRDDV